MFITNKPCNKFQLPTYINERNSGKFNLLYKITSKCYTLVHNFNITSNTENLFILQFSTKYTQRDSMRGTYLHSVTVCGERIYTA